MKGMVFTEFIELVEDNFGFETSDYIITESNLKSNGVYTSVGTYDFHEMVSLLINLEKKTEIPINQLLETFGSHLFFRFVSLFPQFIDKEKSFYDFVSEIDNYIHIEVKKLYPDAELPDFEIIEKVIDDCKSVKDKELPNADAVIIFSCVGRLSALGPLINDELQGIQDTFNAPMAGLFSYGEFGRATNGNHEYHNLTCCWVAIKEK